MNKNHLYQAVFDAQTEEELKFSFAKFFNLKPSTKNRVDLYTEQILFEFKLDDNLKKLKIRSKVIAQALYYVRRLKIGEDDRSPAENLCIVTKRYAAFFKTEIFADFCANNAYDWDLKPSFPCKKLISDISAFEAVIHAHIYDFSVVQEDIAFATMIMSIRKRQISLFNVKKEINDQNFYQVFQHWQNFFGKDVENGHKPSEYFLTDIEDGKSHIYNNQVYFEMNNEKIIRKPLNPDEYKYFWSRYAKISSAREIISIRQKMDRITEINLRRFTGEFYTPINFAKKAFDYLTRTVGQWWKDDNFRLWDMAAGTGNLEFAIPPEAHKFCYVSTLIQDETDYCANIFPESTVFQFDFLNDSAEKLPNNLKKDLADPNIRWIIFINPPYAMPSNFEFDKNRQDKLGVSMTAIRDLMNAENIGWTSQELSTQFLYRISKDFSARKVWLGIFSKLTYIISDSDQKFRDKIFKYKFERGFLFNSKYFEGCKGQFPVGFLIWNLADKISLENQEILLDVYDSDVEKVAEKIYRPARREEYLNKWLERPKQTKKFPPMSSGLNIAYGSKSAQKKVAENFLASFMLSGIDFSNQNYTAFVSGAVARHGSLSITEDNFEQAMVVHMVRKLPKANWLNNKDQFLQPNKQLRREFVTDAVIWSLFSPSNQTASLRDVEYEGEVYQLKNNFFPFKLSEIQSWTCSSPKIRWRIASAHEDRFAATWIEQNSLSFEAREVFLSAKAIYKRFFAELANLDVARWKIDDWDAGWYQIRMSLSATIDLSALSEKLLPQIKEFGFLRDEIKEFK